MATPPDSTGAIGPTRYVEMVNQLVGVFDRSNLTRLSSTDLGSFTAASGLGLTTSDPQIQWDPQGNRWFYGAVGIATGGNYLLFGWSKTADPSDLATGWCQYGSPTLNSLPDYPKLGHDANFVTFGTNVYDDSKAFLFVTADIWAISKPTAAAITTCSTTVTATHFADATHLLKNADGSAAFTPVPANTADAATNDYIVSAHDPTSGSQTKVMVWHMTATPSPLLVADGDISVGSYSVPPNVPQPGVSYLLDSLDGRLTQAVAHFDPSASAEAVWTQHTVAGSGRSIVRWYEFLPATMTIRQQGQLASATDSLWNGSISPSSAGNDAAIFYNRGSSSVFAVAGAQTRANSTPLGQMDAGELLLGSSSAADQETLFSGNCSPNPCRWGDYSGATPDPVNAGVVWGSNQLIGPVVIGLAQWTTQNFAVTTSASTIYVAGAVGTDNGLWVLHSGSASWTGDGGVIVGAPAVVAVPQTSGPASPLYVATGSDHALWVRNDAQGWQSFGAAPTNCIDNPAGVVITGTLYVACEGQDHALWHAETPAPTGTNLPTLNVSGWHSLGGVLVAGPAVGSVAGTPTYLVVGTDQHIYSIGLSSSFTRFSWAACIGHPALATFGSTSYFGCHGTDDALWYATNTGSGWSAPQSLGGTLIDGVGVAATSSGPVFFGEGTDARVWQRTISSGWTSDGGQVKLGIGACSL